MANVTAGRTEAPEVDCSRHPGRASVATCSSCSRAMCLGCAIPVRGRPMCVECVRRELGTPTPAPAPPAVPRSRPADAAAAALFGLGLVATMIPWDRFGILTSPLSAWSLQSGPWSLWASVGIAAGFLLALTGLAGWIREYGRSVGVSYSILGVGAAGGSLWGIIASPPYVSHTPAPLLAVAASAGAAVVGLIALRRGRASRAAAGRQP